MKFSVATPVFNGWPQIRRCVGSVRGQTGVAVRHIVQDGGSTDGGASWLRAQADLDFRCEPDAGMYDAISRCWARADGEVLSWLNADEQYLPGALATVARSFARHPQVQIVYGQSIIVTGEGEPLAARRDLPMNHFLIRNTFLNVYSCALFFRRSLGDQGLLRFCPDYRCAGDMDLILRLLSHRVPALRLPDYLALFGVDGRNLGTAPRMVEETQAIQKEHGGFRQPWVRRAIQVIRWLLRLAAGHYRAQQVAFALALDDVPTYRHFDSVRLGSRFDIQDYARERRESLPRAR